MYVVISHTECETHKVDWCEATNGFEPRRLKDIYRDAAEEEWDDLTRQVCRQYNRCLAAQDERMAYANGMLKCQDIRLALQGARSQALATTHRANASDGCAEEHACPEGSRATVEAAHSDLRCMLEEMHECCRMQTEALRETARAMLLMAERKTIGTLVMEQHNHGEAPQLSVQNVERQMITEAV